MRKMILLAFAALAAASCTRGLDEPAVIGGDEIRFVVGDFPAFGGSETRAVGTDDRGKTEWAEGDELLLEMTSNTLGTKYAAFTYNGSNWELASGELSYKEDEYPTFPHVYYAPNYKWEAGKLVLKEDKVAGTDEFIEGIAQITPNGEAITVSFSNAKRDYSRLRIATLPNVDVAVSVQYFTPAGPASQVSTTYTLHSDAKGNAYLYGSFVKNSTVSVAYGNAVLASYTFGKASEGGKSYVLDATVVSMEGMSGDSTKIMEAIEAEVKRGNKDIRLMLPYDLGKEEADGILGGLDGLDAGSINLTLMGCKKIAFQGFKNCKQLKSVTLPDVTEICESAFAACSRLEKVVFGTPLTKVYGDPETFGGGIFEGCDTERIDLVLSGEQNQMSFSQVEGKDVWTAVERQPYKGCSGHMYSQFLGYTFMSVNCGGETH